MSGVFVEEMKAKGRVFVEELEDRYDNYAILSRLFREEVDCDLLVELKDSPAVELTGCCDFDNGYARLRAYLSAVEDVPKKKSELAIDFCGVFLGYGVDPNDEDEEKKIHAAYPYESIYTSGSKTLTGGLAEGVTLEYRAYGFAPTKERILADDHMACELEFLKYLVGCEIAYARDDDYEKIPELRKAELTFIEEHPFAWIEKFEDAIKQRAEVDFYPALALMAKGWLEMDSNCLKGECCD